MDATAYVFFALIVVGTVVLCVLSIQHALHTTREAREFSELRALRR